MFFSCIALRSPFSGSWFTIISLNFNESSSQIWLLWTIDENFVWIWSSAQSSNSVSVSSRVQVCPLAVIANVKINRKIKKTWTLHYRCKIRVGESKMAHKFGISRGTCQGQVTSLPVILGRLRINAFTLQNLFHVLGSKLPHGGGLDPHCRCGIDVASKPHILCSHYAGKWSRPGSTPWPCIKWA